MAVTKDDVVEFIASMSVLELSEFIKELEEKFGVSAAAPVAVAAAGAAPAAATATGAAAETPNFSSSSLINSESSRTLIFEINSTTSSFVTAIFISSWRLC